MSTTPEYEASVPSGEAPAGAAESGGVSGQGADSALARLRELEQQRDGPPDADHPLS